MKSTAIGDPTQVVKQAKELIDQWEAQESEGGKELQVVIKDREIIAVIRILETILRHFYCAELRAYIDRIDLKLNSTDWRRSKYSPH